MKLFKLNEHIEVVCESEPTRNGFRHTARLFVDEQEIASAKICYYNRTWEAYEFQAVLQRVIEKAELPAKEKELCMNFANKNHTNCQIHTTGMVAKMGEFFCNTQKEKNDWKERMLRAGLEPFGLSMPKDWDSLSEETKSERLNAVIKQCSETGEQNVR